VILASFITFYSDLSLILTMAKNTSLNRQSYIDRFPLPSAESSKEKLLEMLKHRPCVYVRLAFGAFGTCLWFIFCLSALKISFGFVRHFVWTMRQKGGYHGNCNFHMWYFKLRWNTTALNQSNRWNFSDSGIIIIIILFTVLLLLLLWNRWNTVEWLQYTSEIR